VRACVYSVVLLDAWKSTANIKFQSFQLSTLLGLGLLAVGWREAVCRRHRVSQISWLEADWPWQPPLGRQSLHVSSGGGIRAIQYPSTTGTALILRPRHCPSFPFLLRSERITHPKTSCTLPGPVLSSWPGSPPLPQLTSCLLGPCLGLAKTPYFLLGAVTSRQTTVRRSSTLSWRNPISSLGLPFSLLLLSSLFHLLRLDKLSLGRSHPLHRSFLRPFNS
jgi:hypothetical protein